MAMTDVPTSGVANVDLDRFIREYIERVVNHHDMSAVDEMVSPDYTGGGYGWAEDIAALREVYDRQNRARPDWRIDIQQTVEVGEWVAVRAVAGGMEAYNEDGTRQSRPYVTAVEWLTIFHVVNSRIVETRVISVLDHSGL
jgi:SnoaL-like domain